MALGRGRVVSLVDDEPGDDDLVDDELEEEVFDGEPEELPVELSLAERDGLEEGEVADCVEVVDPPLGSVEDDGDEAVAEPEACGSGTMVTGGVHDPIPSQAFRLAQDAGKLVADCSTRRSKAAGSSSLSMLGSTFAASDPDRLISAPFWSKSRTLSMRLPWAS